MSRDQIAEVIAFAVNATIRRARGSKLKATVTAEDVAGYADAIMALDGWEKIDSAPRDGTWILVYEPCEYEPTQHVVRWGTPEWGGGENTWVTMALGPNPDTYDAENATHWRPLPQPPGDAG